MKNLYKITEGLREYIDFIYVHEVCFLDKFTEGDVWDLVRVSFSVERVYFTYTLESGQHISDNISTDELMVWIRAVRFGAEDI